MPVYLLQVGRKLHVFAVIHRDYDHAGHRLPEGFFQRGDEVGVFFHPVALAVHGLGQQLFADFCKSQFTQKVRGATAFLVLLCFLAFIQRIELLQDLGVFQLDDLAGKVVQGVFLRHIQKADAHRAQRLRFGAGALVHLAVAVFDIAQHRLAQIGQMCTDLMGAPGDKADLAQGKRACGAQHVHIRDDLLAALVLRLMGVDADLVVLLVVLPPCGEPPGLRDTHRDGVVLLFE